MALGSGLVLGFDPGGEDRFGWSICRVDHGSIEAPLATGLASDAWGAFRSAQGVIDGELRDAGSQVLAAGIDAPLYWTRNGSRRTDQCVRDALKEHDHPTPAGTVQQINSLRGACLVQGVLLAKHLHDAYELPITETHPKALLYLLRREADSAMTLLSERLIAELNDHQRDATLSALAAWAMLAPQPGWRDLYPSEPAPLQPFKTPVAYWMPIT